MNKETIAIIGCGNMGTSLVSGLVADGYPSDKIWVTDPDNAKLENIARQLNVKTTVNNEVATKEAKIVLFAVKPQHLKQVSADLADSLQQSKPLIISIAAGVRISSIQEWLKGNIPIVRCMPNTPALIGSGASALFANELVSSHQKNTAESILRAVGLVVWLKEEKQMDAVTAISGSGPAYFFLLIEILQNIAEQIGLSQQDARILTLQTAFGAAKMALESEAPVTELRRNVTSPGGTTEAALRVLENENLKTIFSKAVRAAVTRSEELANLIE